MKKIFLMFVAVMTAVCVNAQVAYEHAKLTDNVYVGFNAGATTPLSFNRVFPLNPTFGVRIGKDLTPIFGVNVEGTTWFGSACDNALRFDNNFGSHNVFRSVNVGLNGTVNLTNLFLGYKGTPRFFELSGLAGFGWNHVFNPSHVEKDYNSLSAKTAVDFNFNFGKHTEHTIYVEPYVFWNLNGDGHGPVQFNSCLAQFGLSVGYAYHFLTSNGTHNFKMYDIGAMNAEIARLNEELAKKPKEVVKEVVTERVVERIVEKPVTYAYTNQYTVYFGKGSYMLTNNAKDVLDSVPSGSTVSVEATASPEGSANFNQALSEQRAEAVAEYLRQRGVNVNDAEGLGVTGDDSQRVARVIVK